MTDPLGVLVVDKPSGWTSHDVVARVRRLVGTRRVGHAGTLDPMATGVLVVGVGRATKLLTFLVGCDKGYAATVRLGVATVTDDAEGEVISRTPAGHLTRERIESAVLRLTGAIDQVPSSVSAIKVAGQRSYARVRSGESVDLPARPVVVSRFEVLAVRAADEAEAPDGALDVDIEVEVSSGTYVRALARDLGRALEVGGHLTALRRTRVGGFTLDQAEDLAALEQRRQAGDGIPMLSVELAARRALPVRELTEPQARAVGFGQPLESDGVRADAVAAFTPAGRLLAVIDQTERRARTRVVFPAVGS